MQTEAEVKDKPGSVQIEFKPGSVQIEFREWSDTGIRIQDNRSTGYTGG